jgi:pilus assembly protein CpaF
VVEPLDPKIQKQLDLQSSILDRLIPSLGIDDVALDRLGDEELWQRAESAIVDLVENMESAGDIPKFVDQDRLVQDTLNEALGLGPLEDLLADETVEEVIVDRRDRILVTRGGTMSSAGTAFSSDDQLRRVVERLVFPTGHTIGEGTPLVDVRLRDGSRLAAAVPPVAVRGACLTLRKPGQGGYDLDGLVGNGAMSAAMATFLTTCIAGRKNILVCGAPSSGKSAVLSALAAASPAGERIVSVEEVSELQIGREDWIPLESRPGDGNGLSNVDVEILLRGAMRMRPDRLVVGDVRGREAFELVQAMASSCDGTLASMTGEGANASLLRLSSLAALFAGGASLESIRDVVGNAVDVVVHVARYADGVVRVAAIEEVIGASEAGFQTQLLFQFQGDSSFAPSGSVPGFYDELKARGIEADTSVFSA